MSQGKAYVFGPYRLVPSERRLTLDGAIVELGSRAFDALTLLVSERGELVSKQQLMDHVWSDVTVDESNLRFQMSTLRRTLAGDAREDVYIKNVPGRGYVFIAPVAEHTEPATSVVSSPRLDGGYLPDRPQHIFGRDTALQELQANLLASRFISVVGAGGIGKTTIANELVHRVADKFDGDIRYIDLGSIKANDLVLPSVAMSVGYRVQSADLVEGLATFLADRRLLLIFDCCEHVIDTVSRLADTLFRRALLCHIITTSREPLRAYGEEVHILEPLALPSDNLGLTAAEALGAPTVQLFMERARASGYNLGLEDKDASIVAAICHQLDGNPLAIELAGSRLLTYGFAELLDRLDGKAILNWPGRRHDVRHRSLEATLDWSFELLTDYERQVLLHLSVFVGPFSMRAAEAILSGDRWLLGRTIEELVDKSLLTSRRENGVSFYRLLDVTRVYAETKLAASGASGQLVRRHAQFFIADLRENPGTPTGVSNPLGNLRAALEWCFSAAGDSSVGVELAAACSEFFLNRSLLKECLRWCQTALQYLREEESFSETGLRLQQSLAISMMYTLGNVDQVGVAISRGLDIAAKIGAREAELHLLAGQNLFLTRRADFLGALRAAQRFAALAHASQVSAQVIASDWMLGSTYNLIGRQKMGQQLLEQATARAEALGIRTAHYFGFDNKQRSLLGRAWTSWLCGQPDKAKSLVNDVLDESVAQNHPVSLCISHLYGAHVVLWLRELDWAERLIETLADVALKHHLGPYQTGARALRGELLLAKGQIEEATLTLEGSLGPLRAEKLNIMLAPATRAYAECLAQLNRCQEADAIILPLIEQTETTSPSYLLPELLRTRADILHAGGEHGEAMSFYLRSLARAKYDGAVGWELRTALSLSRAWNDAGQEGRARTLLESTVELFREGFDSGDVLQAQKLLGRG